MDQPAQKKKQIRRRPDEMARHIAEHLSSRSRGLSRTELIESFSLDVDAVTFWRWLDKAKEMGLVTLQGGKWFASDGLRKSKAIELIREPQYKRPVVPYNELWLRDYIPNKTYYLGENERRILDQRSPVGSARISDMDKSDLATFLCGLPYASSRLEGNNYTMLATVDLIERGVVMPGASRTETQMIMNHHMAARFLVENISYPPQDGDVSINGRDIRTLHSLLADNLLREPGMAGKFRHGTVLIQDSSYRPLDLPESIENSFMIMVEKASQIVDPFEQAFFLVVHLPYLQPFVDCNKRTSRLACNIPLLRAGVAPMSWLDIEGDKLTDALLCIYELNEIAPMAELFTQGYLRSVERFNILKHSRAPVEAITIYSLELNNYIRGVVLGNEPTIPPNVEAVHHQVFLDRVEAELKEVATLERGPLFKYQLRPGDVEDWLRSEQASGQGARPRERAA